MNPPFDLETSRLRLRRWKPSDAEPFAALNADPRVAEFLHVMTRAESDALIGRIEAGFEKRGYGLWALEVPGVTEFAGFVGLSVPRFETHFTPCVEIGWRLAFEHWGKGYATEAARAALAFGFERPEIDEIVAFTVPANVRSRRVMEKIGMTLDPAGDFDHPLVEESDPMRRHVLYRVRRETVRSPKGAEPHGA